MKMPRATLRILHQPHIGRGVVRFEVDCKYSTTGLTHVPSPAIPLTDEMLILAAAYAHEERCGECDVSQVLERGDQEIRDWTERTWAAIQGEMVMRSRRN